MVSVITEDEEVAHLEELDEFDIEAEDIIHEMTDWVKFELDN